MTIGRKKCPTWLPEDLESTYNRTDLTWEYAEDRFREISIAKQVPISVATMAAWFTEFMRRKWTKKIFDGQVAIVREAMVFNRIDLADWLKSERMFPEFELNLHVEEAIKKKLHDGQYYSEMIIKGIKLDPKQEAQAHLYAAEQLKQEFLREVSIAFEKLQDEIVEAGRKKAKEKKTLIKRMTTIERGRLLDKIIELGLITVKSREEYGGIVKYLESYHSLIPDELIAIMEPVKCQNRKKE